MEFPVGNHAKVGIHGKWVNLIMQCISTVQYKILHNGTESDPIMPGRGLRQGDPLFPFLFIICVAGLSSTLRNMQERGLIHGCNIARSAPPISHLFFADNSYFFFNASMEECNRVKVCLNQYESF